VTACNVAVLLRRYYSNPAEMARSLLPLSPCVRGIPMVERKPVAPAGESDRQPIRDCRYVVFGIAGNEREVP